MKLKLDDLVVKSFVTMDKKEAGEIYGGSNYCDPTVGDLTCVGGPNGGETYCCAGQSANCVSEMGEMGGCLSYPHA